MGYDKELKFEKVMKVPFQSKKAEDGSDNAFVANEMSGGSFKSGEFKLFINRTDKRKGLVINDVSDLTALMMLCKKLDAKYNN